MSTSPDNELDLEKLFLPAWAQEPPSAKHYAHFEGEDEDAKKRGRERRGRRTERWEGGPGARPRENRPAGEQRERPRRRDDRKRLFEKRPPFPRGEEPERREPPSPLPEVNILFLPEDKGVESLARQIKTTGRAYPLFDVARLILQKPDRYLVAFKVKKKPDGQIAQPLYVCALDDTLWLSEDEAVAHVLKNHFGTFYQTERTATEPPKGKYTFVAQCGMSGVVLGPPNYHDYQNQLRRLHAERFSRMPFEAFKSRVKIVRDEDVVNKWIEDQSWRTEYICLNLPEPLHLGSLEAVEKHFREVHRENIIKATETHTMNGAVARALRCHDLTRLVRQGWEEQRRFPLQIATALSHQFAAHGLQFFKVNRAITHVSVARPHFLDLATTPVSDGVRRIVEFINSRPKCTRRQILEVLAPARLESRAAGGGTGDAAQPPESGTPNAGPPAASEPAPAATESTPPSAAAAEPTPEQTAIIADLHWLIHQGHVIEFANGILDTAKKPAPKPPKPEPTLAEQTTETVSAAEPAEALETPPEPGPATEPVSITPELDQPNPVVSLPLETEPAPAPAVAEAQDETPAAPSELHS